MNNQQALIPPPNVYQHLLAMWQRVRKPLLAVRWALAALGLIVVLGMLSLWLKPNWFMHAENSVFEWLSARREQLVEVFSPEAVSEEQKTRETKSQALLAGWLARKYFVAEEPLKKLVVTAYEEGRKANIDPLLILAVAATESRFNPIAQSEAGAQGLMQVMTKIHADKYAKHGGTERAFDAVINLRVGVMVLKETIGRAGSIEGGLKYYVGAANLDSDGGYADKVLGEMQRLSDVAAGKKVSMLATTRLVAPVQEAASSASNVSMALEPGTAVGALPLSVSTELSTPPRVLQSMSPVVGVGGVSGAGGVGGADASTSSGANPTTKMTQASPASADSANASAAMK